MKAITWIIGIANNLIGLINKTPLKEVKERQDEITDYKTPVYNKRQIQAELKFLRDHHRMTQKARGEEKTDYQLPAGKTIHQAYMDVITELEK